VERTAARSRWKRNVDTRVEARDEVEAALMKSNDRNTARTERGEEPCVVERGYARLNERSEDRQRLHRILAWHW
jgi:hypothetical protein